MIACELQINGDAVAVRRRAAKPVCSTARFALGEEVPVDFGHGVWIEADDVRSSPASSRILSLG